MNKIFKVVEILEQTKIVINAGSNHGIRDNQRFLIYSLDGKEIIDPDTGKSLGHLEVVKGTGTATFVHENMCTVTSDMYSKYDPLSATTDSNLVPVNISKIGTKTHLPFNDIKIGDFVKPI
ncbi:MAG: hypothetical protein E7J31_05270 [Clostridium sp.]|uniref:hypothetical protein n=1 Tax=Clostridium sp. TaxID=1506 RepID=UPI00290793A2|nr:hypothetical protein [Clostridium sp.]MDU7947829.1 hypothetical protein [Clostridium sp.]